MKARYPGSILELRDLEESLKALESAMSNGMLPEDRRLVAGEKYAAKLQYYRKLSTAVDEMMGR